MESRPFPFAFDPRFRLPLAAVGVRPGTAEALVDDAGLHVRFGPWAFSTPWDNIKDVQVGGPYRWWRAIGARGSFADWGVTFGTNTDAGVCVCFHDPIPALLPGEWIRHPGATLTVADVDGLAEVVRGRLAT